MAVYHLPTWLLLLLIPLLLLLKKFKEANRLNKLLPPSPPKSPVIGNLQQLGALPHHSFRQLSQKYGPVMLLEIGRTPVVIISSAEAARDIFKTNDVDSCSRPNLTGIRKLTYNFKDVAFAPYGNYWRDIRKLCVLELFSLKRVPSFRSIREEEVGLAMDSISQSSASATPVDLSTMMFALDGNITFRTAFGKRVRARNYDTHRSRLIHAATTLLGSFNSDEFLRYKIGWIIDKLNNYHATLDRVFHELDDFLEEVISEHLKPEATPQDHQEEDIVDVLLKLENREFGETRITKDHIKAVFLDIFVGGIDTGAVTMIWATVELTRNPRVMKKAQHEVRNCIGKKGRVSESDVDELQYLKMIIKETLRFYDRFTDSSIDFKGQNFEFLPFGSGPRSCPGIHFALSKSELALANLLYGFDWKLPNGMKEEDVNMEEVVGQSLTIRKKIPLILVPVNRLQ